MWFKIPYKFSLQSMHKQKKKFRKNFFFFFVDKLQQFIVQHCVVVCNSQCVEMCSSVQWLMSRPYHCVLLCSSLVCSILLCSSLVCSTVQQCVVLCSRKLVCSQCVLTIDLGHSKIQINTCTLLHLILRVGVKECLRPSTNLYKN